jgi:oligosaccharide repeat unit polymerase
VNETSKIYYILAIAMLCLAVTVSDTLVSKYLYAQIIVVIITFNIIQRKEIDLLRPIYGITVLLILYSTAPLIFAVKNGATHLGHPINDLILSKYMYANLFGTIGLSLGTFIAAKTRGNIWPNSVLYNRRYDNDEYRERLYYYAIAFTIILLPFIWKDYDITNVIGYSTEAFSMRRAMYLSSSSGVIKVITRNMPNILIVSALTILIMKGKSRLLIAAASAILFIRIATAVMAGYRGDIMRIILIPIIYYHYRVKTIKIKSAIIGCLIIYMFVNVMSIARVSSDPVEMISSVTKNFKKNGLEILGLNKSTELLSASNLMRLIAAIENRETEYKGVNAIIGEIQTYIPRIILPERPVGLSYQYIRELYPGIYEKGGGLGFYILMEGYWTYGYLGVLLNMMLYGFIIEKVYIAIRARNCDMSTMLYSYTYYAIVIGSVRTGMMLSLKTMLLGWIPMIVLYIMPRPKKTPST